MAQQQGRLLGNRYRLRARIGQGGMGTVWRAHDETLDRAVAVKEVLLPPGLSPAEREILYKRTFREARASARLNHPNVVTVHDVVNDDARPWIVMELVPAPSLQDILDEQGTLAPVPVAEIGRQVLGALAHAHRAGILHRDVKPSNVLITDDGRAVLTDFGIAQMEGDATLTATGLVMGSPAYIPPERVQGERAVPASDLWALGATLYTATEGRAPYERPDAMAALAAALTEEVPPPRNSGPLRPVLDGLLARTPADRMTAASALPLLTDVAKGAANLNRLSAGLPLPRKLPETVLDEPRTGARLAPEEVSETVLDSGSQQLKNAWPTPPAAETTKDPEGSPPDSPAVYGFPRVPPASPGHPNPPHHDAPRHYPPAPAQPRAARADAAKPNPAAAPNPDRAAASPGRRAADPPQPGTPGAAGSPASDRAGSPPGAPASPGSAQPGAGRAGSGLGAWAVDTAQDPEGDGPRGAGGAVAGAPGVGGDEAGRNRGGAGRSAQGGGKGALPPPRDLRGYAQHPEGGTAREARAGQPYAAPEQRRGEPRPYKPQQVPRQQAPQVEQRPGHWPQPGAYQAQYQEAPGRTRTVVIVLAAAVVIAVCLVAGALILKSRMG